MKILSETTPLAKKIKSAVDPNGLGWLDVYANAEVGVAAAQDDTTHRCDVAIIATYTNGNVVCSHQAGIGWVKIDPS